MDLPRPPGPHPGRRHRRPGPAPVPLPRRVAAEPRPGEVRPHARVRPRPCPSSGTASSSTSRRTASGRDRVLACAARLLDLGFFRIGTEGYAEENQTYGLATIQKRHVKLAERRGAWSSTTWPRAASAGSVGGRPRWSTTWSPPSSSAGAGCPSCWPGAGGRAAGWRGSTCGPPTSTPTSRRSPAGSSRPRTSARGTPPCWPRWPWPCRPGRPRPTPASGPSARAFQEVAHYLGNTPAVCRSSYVDPRVVDHYQAGLHHRRRHRVALDWLDDRRPRHPRRRRERRPRPPRPPRRRHPGPGAPSPPERSPVDEAVPEMIGRSVTFH